jgi:hypothetical protein
MLLNTNSTAATDLERLQSPAWRALPISARRAIECFEVELGHVENGHLASSYRDLEAHGVNHCKITGALRQLVALGIVAASHAGNGKSLRYRLTYRPADGRPPTNDWRHISSIEEGKSIARSVRDLKGSITETAGPKPKSEPAGVPADSVVRIGDKHYAITVREIEPAEAA